MFIFVKVFLGIYLWQGFKVSSCLSINIITILSYFLSLLIYNPSKVVNLVISYLKNFGYSSLYFPCFPSFPKHHSCFIYSPFFATMPNIFNELLFQQQSQRPVGAKRGLAAMPMVFGDNCIVGLAARREYG